jgi:hypothetical protein
MILICVPYLYHGYMLDLTCLFFFAAPVISVSRRPSDWTALLLSRAGIRSLIFHMQCFVKSVGSVMKPTCHPFRTNMSHMCHTCVIHVRCEGLKLSLFGQHRSGQQSVVFTTSYEFE